MKKFIRKLSVHSVLLLLIIIGVVIVRYTEQTRLVWPDLGKLPTHFVSNSVCFNTKLDHAKQDNRLLSAKLLVMGSSMGLNNVSGAIISTATGTKAYNFSSWGFKPHESYEVLKQLDGKLGVEHLIIPFNNTEFLADDKQIYYEGVYDYFFATNALKRVRNYFINFTLDGFVRDWSFRTNYIEQENAGYTLKFKEDGSVMLQPKNFIFGRDNRHLVYCDTTGFEQFNRSIKLIEQYCNQHHIELTLVYLPWRKDILTPNRMKQEQAISNRMRATYGRKFIDLSRLPVADEHFVDAGHMFAGGATVVTHAMLDTLTLHRRIALIEKPKIGQQRRMVAHL